MRKHPHSHREAKATAPVLDSTRHFSAGGWPNLTSKLLFRVTRLGWVTRLAKSARWASKQREQ
jgi:hypothetical protein